MLAYGASAAGKTRFACGAPEPLVVDADKGSHKFETTRIVPRDWDDALEIVTAVEKGEIACKTLVLDSITELEAMSHKKLFGDAGIDKYDGGYGRGDTASILAWRELLAQLERIWTSGKSIVLVAHATVKAFNDPTLSAPYDRYEVAARPKLAGLLRAWADFVLFCRIQTVTEPERGKRPARAVTTGVRLMHTRTCPAYDAKARGTLLFPDTLPLSWEDFARAVAGEKEQADAMRAQLDASLLEIGDGALTKRVYAWLKDNPNCLVEAFNRVQEIVSDKRKANPAPSATVADAPAAQTTAS